LLPSLSWERTRALLKANSSLFRALTPPGSVKIVRTSNCEHNFSRRRCVRLPLRCVPAHLASFFTIGRFSAPQRILFFQICSFSIAQCLLHPTQPSQVVSETQETNRGGVLSVYFVRLPSQPFCVEFYLGEKDVTFCLVSSSAFGISDLHLSN